MQPFTKEEKSQFSKCFCKSECEYVRVGTRGYVLPSLYTQYAEEIRQMPLRSTDIWVITFPRSGTTWTQELVWLVNNDMNFEEAKSVWLTKRYTKLDSFAWNSFESVLLKSCTNENSRISLKDTLSPIKTRQLAITPSPRFIKCHMPLSLLPANTLDTCKVVYVARDPRDVLVSQYHYFKDTSVLQCELKEYFDLFIKNLSPKTPYFEHVKEAWVQRHHPNMLFIFYEDLSKDLKGTAKKVAAFFGKTYTEEHLDQLCEHLEFKNFQKNRSVSDKEFTGDLGTMFGKEYSKMFVRKGKAGGWRDEFDAEMTARAQAWMQDNLQDMDLRFPLQEF